MRTEEPRQLVLWQSYLVVNICNVHDKVDLEAEIVQEDTSNDVGRDVVARMAKMALVVHSRTAGIHADFGRIERFKIAQATCVRVK